MKFSLALGMEFILPLTISSHPLRSVREFADFLNVEVNENNISSISNLAIKLENQLNVFLRYLYQKNIRY